MMIGRVVVAIVVVVVVKNLCLSKGDETIGRVRIHVTQLLNKERVSTIASVSLKKVEHYGCFAPLAVSFFWLSVYQKNMVIISTETKPGGPWTSHKARQKPEYNFCGGKTTLLLVYTPGLASFFYPSIFEVQLGMFCQS